MNQYLDRDGTKFILTQIKENQSGLSKNIYDPQGKETDIFGYIDASISSAIGDINKLLQDRLNGVIGT